MDYLEEENQKRKRFILFFFLISILLHGFLGLVLYIIPKFVKGPDVAKQESQVVWVTPEISNPTEIADIEKPKTEQRPPKAKFVGQYDSSPKEEVVARPKPKPKVIQENPDSSEEPEKVAKASKASEVQKPVPEKVAEKIKKEPITPQATAVEGATQTPGKDLSDFSLKPEDVFKPTKVAKNDSASSPKDLSFKSAGSGLSVGRSSASDLFMHDYYPDYKIGGKTYLNVMKLQDVGYFVRMKRILKMRWNPVPSVERYLMSNRLTMGKIECVVGVSLNSSGNIAELFMIRSSGIGAYDQEALQTLKDSSPFASPPEQFLKDGQLHMSWTFTVYL